MNKHWLWDTSLNKKEVKKILKDENNPKFVAYAEKLLARSSNAKEVFSLVEKKSFCRKWHKIKKRLNKDKWARSKVVFWQVIYDSVKDRLKRKGVKIRKELIHKAPAVRQDLAKQIRKLRTSLGYTQKEVAKQLGVAQQYISKIESGKENVSIGKLVGLASIFNKKIMIKLK